MKTKPLTPLATLLLLLTGCAAPFETTCPTEEGASGDTLTILDHGAFDYMYAAIKPKWENATGTKLVTVNGGDAGSALQTAMRARGGSPPADVIYGVDNALFHTGARAGIFEPYASPNLNRLSPQLRVSEFRDDEGKLLATPADHGYITVNYDARLVGANPAPPASLNDLATPTWAQRFVVEDPRLSSPGLGFLIATVATFGENDDYDFLDYWSDLFRNGVLVAPDWTSAYVVHFSAGYGQGSEGFQGDRQLVVSYSTSPAYEAQYTQTPPSISLEPPRGVFHQVETVAILRCTPNLALAQRFVDFVLSDAFQDDVAANMAVYPATTGGAILPQFDEFATQPDRLEPAPFTSAQLDEGVPRWLQAWYALYQTEYA